MSYPRYPPFATFVGIIVGQVLTEMWVSGVWRGGMALSLVERNVCDFSWHATQNYHTKILIDETFGCCRLSAAAFQHTPTHPHTHVHPTPVAVCVGVLTKRFNRGQLELMRPKAAGFD